MATVAKQNGDDELDDAAEKKRMAQIRQKLARRWASTSSSDSSNSDSNSDSSSSESDSESEVTKGNTHDESGDSDKKAAKKTKKRDSSNGLNDSTDGTSIEDLLRRYYPETLQKMHGEEAEKLRQIEMEKEEAEKDAEKAAAEKPAIRRLLSDDRDVRVTNHLSVKTTKKERRLSLNTQQNRKEKTVVLSSLQPTESSTSKTKKKSKKQSKPDKAREHEERKERRKSLGERGSGINGKTLGPRPINLRDNSGSATTNSPKRERRALAFGETSPSPTPQVAFTPPRIETELASDDVQSKDEKNNKRKSRLSLNLHKLPGLMSTAPISPHSISPRGSKTDRSGESPQDQAKETKQKKSKGDSDKESSLLSPLVTPRRRKTDSSRYEDDDESKNPLSGSGSHEELSSSKDKKEKKKRKKMKLRRHTRNLTDQLKRPSGGFSLIIPTREKGTNGSDGTECSPNTSPRNQQPPQPGTFIVRGASQQSINRKKPKKPRKMADIEQPRSDDNLLSVSDGNGSKNGSRIITSPAGSRGGSRAGSRIVKQDNDDSPSLILGEWGHKQQGGTVGADDEEMEPEMLEISYSDVLASMYSREVMLKREEDRKKIVEQKRKHLEQEHETLRQRREAMTDVNKKKKWGLLMSLPSNVNQIKDDIMEDIEENRHWASTSQVAARKPANFEDEVIDLAECTSSGSKFRRRSRSIDEGSHRREPAREKKKGGTTRGRIRGDKEAPIERKARLTKEERSISKLLLVDPAEGDKRVAQRERAEQERLKRRAENAALQESTEDFSDCTDEV